jgi:hypothetical protein
MTSRDWYPINWICLRISETLMGGVAQQERDLARKIPILPIFRM